MSLTTKLAILAALPDSALRIGSHLGLRPVDVLDYLEKLRQAGHARKVNARSYRLA